MAVYLTALNPTASVTGGFLPAAARLGLDVVVVTDQPAEHAAAYAGHPNPPAAVVRCDVRDPGDVAGRVLATANRGGPAEALVTNSDHLQAATAVAAGVLGLPAKSVAAAVSSKNKALMRRRLAAAGLDAVRATEIRPGDDPARAGRDLPFPAVLKPRAGVASEDVYVCDGPAELAARVAEVRRRRPDEVLLAEEFLAGELRTYETLGDAGGLVYLGSWRTTISPPPRCAELRLDWAPTLPAAAHNHLRAQLALLGVGLGAAHTEFVLQGDRARIVEVNYRLPGDAMDLALVTLLGIDLFAEVLAVHLGRPIGERARRDPATLGRHARLDYVFADRAGVLGAAPHTERLTWSDSTTVGHQRLREVGVAAALTGTNRDYLSAVYGVGPDAGSVGDAVEQYRATRQWVIVEPDAVPPDAAASGTVRPQATRSDAAEPDAAPSAAFA
ncbi:MAG: siderophore biosynthesis protein [Frankia sp.]